MLCMLKDCLCQALLQKLQHMLRKPITLHKYRKTRKISSVPYLPQAHQHAGNRQRTQKLASPHCLSHQFWYSGFDPELHLQLFPPTTYAHLLLLAPWHCSHEHLLCSQCPLGCPKQKCGILGMSHSLPTIHRCIVHEKSDYTPVAAVSSPPFGNHRGKQCTVCHGKWTEISRWMGRWVTSAERIRWGRAPVAECPRVLPQRTVLSLVNGYLHPGAVWCIVNRRAEVAGKRKAQGWQTQLPDKAEPAEGIHLCNSHWVEGHPGLTSFLIQYNVQNTLKASILCCLGLIISSLCCSGCACF